MSRQPVKPEPSEFSQLADSPQPGLIAEFWDFLKHNKRWWLLPVLFAILVLGGLVVLAGTGLAPFIYPFV